VEKKRGRGMFVTEGARKNLLKDERQRFIEKEWPRIAATIERLGLDAAALVAGDVQPDGTRKGGNDG
jgi:GntR family transcriptional regulator